MLFVSVGINYNTYANTNEKVVYEDEYGLKIVEVSRVDKFVGKLNENVLPDSGVAQTNGYYVTYNKSDEKGEASMIATFKNENSPVENSFDYSNSHKWTNKTSASGEFNFGAVAAKLVSGWEETYKTTITYHVTVPAGKNVNLWSAPAGDKYTFTVYEGSKEGKKLGTGSFTNYSRVIVNPVYF